MKTCQQKIGIKYFFGWILSSNMNSEWLNHWTNRAKEIEDLDMELTVFKLKKKGINSDGILIDKIEQLIKDYYENGN